MASGTFNRAAVAAWLAATLPGVALAGSPDDSARDALHFLGRLNSPDVLEPAGCHGSLGLAIGAGASAYEVPETSGENPVLAAQLGDGAAQPSGTYSVPRLWLTKGLPWPVDLALSAGSPSGRPGGLTQATGLVQWTVYEAFAMPALAVRGSYGKLFGVAGTELSSISAEAVASYGFLRYFTVFGVLGAVQHHGSLTLDDPLATTGGLAVAGMPPEQVQETWTEPVKVLGLKAVVLPPFVAVTAEAELGTSGRVQDVAAKLSYGL